MTRIPKVCKGKIIAALRRFDAELRETEDWQKWPTRADKNAIHFEGRHYPPKFVIHLATGVPINTFSGGREANTYLEVRGFEIVRLRPDEDIGALYRNTYLITAIQLGEENGEAVTAAAQEGGWIISTQHGDGLTVNGEWYYDLAAQGRTPNDDEMYYPDVDACIVAWEKRRQRLARAAKEVATCAAS